MAISNKELQWWIKFITEKIKCIIDILNISKDIQKMEDAFNVEMRAAKNSIKKAPESIANCSTSSKSIIDELNLYQDKAKVSINLALILICNNFSSTGISYLIILCPIIVKLSCNKKSLIS